MGNVININSLEELGRFLNDNGIMEIAMRGKEKKFKQFFKVAIDNVQQPEAKEELKKVIEVIKKNNAAADIKLGNIAKLNELSLILDGLNLCATCVGFAIMYVKLDKMSAQINEIVALQKKSADLHANFEFNKVLSEHSDMLDCRKTQSYYSAERMRSLVSREYDVLQLLIEVFTGEITGSSETLVFSILSLASMLAVSLKYFDEAYYFKNREAIGDGDIWHLDHDKWVSVFDKLASPEFTEKVQDCGFLDMNLNTVETDSFYKGFINQVGSLKQEIEDNQTLIVSVGDPEILKAITEQTTKEVMDEIKNAFAEAGADIGICGEAIRAVTA